MPFRNRSDAGKKLAVALKRYDGQNPVILALPRGGVPVAAEVAALLHAPLDLVLVRKIGVPMQPELAMGAVVDGVPPIIVRNEDFMREAMISETEFKQVCDVELAEIARRRRLYLGDRRATVAYNDFLKQHLVGVAFEHLRPIQISPSLGDPLDRQSEIQRLLAWGAESGHFDLKNIPDDWRIRK
jgi:hypothetical protein